MSSIATDKGFYHGKSFLHHYPGRGSGFMWKLFGEKPHALDGLDLLPSTTALALFSDGNAPLLWSVIREEVGRAGIPQAESALNQIPQAFEMSTGLNWNKVLGSLGGEFGLVVTLDDTRMIPIPLPGTGLEIPEPGIALVIKVNDDTIFERIDLAMNQMMGQGPGVVSVNEGDLKMRTVPLPPRMPMVVRPSLGTSGGYLFISTSDAMIRDMLAVKGGKKPGLKSTDEFKRLSQDVPLEGNQFLFLSQRLGKTIMAVQRKAMDMQSRENPAALWMKSMIDPEKAGYCFNTTANTEEGWLTVGNGNQHPTRVLLVAAAIPAALAAIAVPNFVRARSVSQQNVCINNLRQLDGAKQQWALENNKNGTATPTRAELAPYLPGNPLICPQGGHYTLGAVGEHPTCSVPGHRLW